MAEVGVRRKMRASRVWKVVKAQVCTSTVVGSKIRLKFGNVRIGD